MALKLITGPSVEPISLAEAKLFLRVTGSDEDALITRLITLAREKAEALTNRAFITQTWEETFCSFYAQCGYLELQKPPVQAVASVKYYDANGVLQTLATSIYEVDDYATPCRICLAYGQSWPGIRIQKTNPIIVRFTCGYGDTADTVPEQLRHWMEVRIAEAYQNREANYIGQITELPRSYLDGLLDSETVYFGV